MSSRFKNLALIGALMTVACAAFGIVSGCEIYDPPPEPELVLPDGGRWFQGDPFIVTFTEPVDPATLKVSVWPRALNIEGELLPDAVPVTVDCLPGSGPCNGITMTLSEENTRLTIDYGAALDDLLGEPIIIALSPGLADPKGNDRSLRSWHFALVSPDCVTGPLELGLISQTFALTSNLSSIIPGVYLRMYIDFAINADDGRFVAHALVARNDGGEPNSTDASYFTPIIDGEGWAVPINGIIGTTSTGQYCVVSDPFTFDVKVLGLLRVILEEFKLELTLTPARISGDARDTMKGLMSSSAGSLEGSDLGAVAAVLIAEGFSAEELAFEGLPEVCMENPCAILDEAGGDCQIASPYVAPSWCPETPETP